jgi:hypothetical protein
MPFNLALNRSVLCVSAQLVESVGFESPDAADNLAGKCHFLEVRQTSEIEPTLKCRSRRGWRHAQVEQAVWIALGQTLQAPIQGRESVRVNVSCETFEHVELAAIPQCVRREFDRSMPQPIADVVTTDDEVAATGIAPIHDDVDVRLIRIVVDARDVVERRSNVVFHAPHEVAPELLKIEVAAAFRRHDEAELVPARQATVGEGVDVVPIEFAGWTEEASTTALAIGAIACEIGEMFANGFRWRLASHGHNARLHDGALRVSADSTDAFASRVSRSLRSTRPATSR